MPVNPAVKAYADATTAYQDSQDKAIEGLSGDVAAQKALIEKLQNSPDGWTADDQAVLDQLQARTKAATDKLEALDNLTPPTPPTA